MQKPPKLEGLLRGALLFFLLSSQRARAATLRPVWQPNGPVEALLLSGGTLYLGGSFTALTSPNGASSVARSNLAALDWASGVPMAWDPKANGPVYALAVQGPKLFAGGSFSWAGGMTVSALAQLDPNNNTAAAWAPAVNGSVRSLASNGGTLFLGGDFSQVAGQARTALAEVNTGAATVTSFDAALAGSAPVVRALAVSGSQLYIGGSFSSVDAAPRAGLAAVKKTDGSLRPWDPAWSLAPGPIIYSVFPLGGALWVGGEFTGTAGASAVQRLASLDLSTAQPLWLPAGPDAAVQAMVADNNGRVHAGGLFAVVDGLARRRYASYFQSAPQVETAYTADLDSGSTDIRAILAQGSEVALGGKFSQVDGQNASNLAVLSLPALGAVPSLTPTPTPGPSGSAAPSTPGSAFYVYPQPGPCGGMKVALPFAGPGQAVVHLRSARGTLLRAQTLSNAAAGLKRADLDCAGLAAGLYWLEVEPVDGVVAPRPPVRFILLER